MINFNIKCPKNYPLKCNLPDTEKDVLVRSEKYKGFLMYQFTEQSDYIIPSIKDYFKTPTFYLFDAQEQPGLGTKFCKICRFTLASDFGIASLTPLNFNVFLEVGLMLGLGKQVIYLVNKDFNYKGQSGAKAMPFDISGEMVVEHASADDLKAKLEKEVPSFIEKVQLSMVYEKEYVEYVKKKLASLNDHYKKILRFFVLEQSQGILDNSIQRLFNLYDNTIGPQTLRSGIRELIEFGMIKSWYPPRVSGISYEGPLYTLEERYRDILKQLLFRD